jgi:hypothetical protein
LVFTVKAIVGKKQGRIPVKKTVSLFLKNYASPWRLCGWVGLGGDFMKTDEPFCFPLELKVLA